MAPVLQCFYVYRGKPIFGSQQNYFPIQGRKILGMMRDYR